MYSCLSSLILKIFVGLKLSLSKVYAIDLKSCASAANKRIAQAIYLD
jgi:hypothetical protein